MDLTCLTHKHFQIQIHLYLFSIQLNLSGIFFSKNNTNSIRHTWHLYIISFRKTIGYLLQFPLYLPTYMHIPHVHDDNDLKKKQFETNEFDWNFKLNFIHVEIYPCLTQNALWNTVDNPLPIFLFKKTFF